MHRILTFLVISSILSDVDSFFTCQSTWGHSRTFRAVQTQADNSGIEPAETKTDAALVSATEKFKVVTCMSTSCSTKRKSLGMDPLSTFAAFYSRSKGHNEEPLLRVEEGPCLGSCKNAPCVAVEHDDFVGSVSLEGMNDGEFSDRVFHNIITEEDADRVWSCVSNAVRTMAEEEPSEA